MTTENKPLELHYYTMNFIDKESLEQNGCTCPSCANPEALSVVDSFMKDSVLYHGAIWGCTFCQDSFITIDTSTLLPFVSEEIKESGPIKIEFFRDEVEDLLRKEAELLN